MTAYRTSAAKGLYAGELSVPALAEQALFFGPSMHLQHVTNAGVENKVVLWVGGKGLTEDGKWGEPINFFWTQPPEFTPADRNKAAGMAKVILRQHFDEIAKHYTHATVRIIISMLENTIDGHIYDRLFSRAEAKEFSHV